MKLGLIDVSNMSISILIVKNNFYEIFTICQAQISPKIKNAQNLLKFSAFDVSNIAISVLMSKMVFKKYVAVVRPN